MTDEGECNIPDAFLKSAGIITHTMNESSEKIKEKKTFLRLGFFLNWGKSHLNSIGKWSKIRPLRTQKNHRTLAWQVGNSLAEIPVKPSYLEL